MSRSFVPILVSVACLALVAPAVACARPGDFDLVSHTAPRTAAMRALEKRLGPEARVTVSAATRTPWNLLRTDRPLTGPSGRAAHRIALDFLRRHRNVFRLGEAQLEKLGRPEVTISPNGTRHLRWPQVHAGLPVAGADLRAHVAADGRLLAVQGGPMPDADPNGTTTLGHGPTSRRGLRPDAHTELVVAATEQGPKAAWLQITEPGPQGSEAILRTAEDGELLARVALGRDASGYANVWDARPTDPRRLIEMPDRWLSSTSALRGDFTYVIAYVMYPDETITDPEGNGGDVPPSTTLEGLPAWDEPYEPITSIYDPAHSPNGGLGCSPLYPCSWSSFRPYSWVTNLRHAAVQTFVYINRFRDHLAAPPIGFDHESGGFESHTPGGDDGDPIEAFVMAAASLLDGVPPPNYLNNARMNVRPDGQSSQMTLYLFGGDPELPAIDANPAEHAVIVYHEYAHGLTGRLVTDSRGVNTMTTLQAGALGEGLSDWYALDYLEATGAVTDDPVIPGEILADADLTAGRLGFRHSAIDCPVGATGSPLCPPGGGFTFAQFAEIEHDDEGRPIFDYHADGEIMSQTLWDLRRELIATYGRDEGIRRARELVTEGLRLLAPYPSFTDMRDGILLADVASGGADRDLIWRVFARRGMGFGANAYYTETHPEASFELPPSPRPKPDPGPPPTQSPPGSTPGPTLPAPPPAANTRPGMPRLRGKPVFPARALARLRSRAGLAVRVRVDATARVAATLSLPTGAAKRYRLGRRLASARIARLPAGRVGTLRFRLPPHKRLRLRKARALRLTLTIRLKGNGGAGPTRIFRKTVRG